tara:strand:- start:7786 stop:8112 length:327 start_codon:yes stop_codon:yes gene_type:complete
VIGEILAGIRVLSTEHAFLNELEDHVSDIRTLRDTPLLKQCQSHWSKFLKSVVSESMNKFRTAYMALLPVLFSSTFQSEIQSVLEKKIGSRLKAVFAFENIFNSGVKS